MSQGPVINFYGTKPKYVCPRVQPLEKSISLGHKKPVQVFSVSLQRYLIEMF
jgi:hypothetical protein